jgi:hypothetical protein
VHRCGGEPHAHGACRQHTHYDGQTRPHMDESY